MGGCGAYVCPCRQLPRALLLVSTTNMLTGGVQYVVHMHGPDQLPHSIRHPVGTAVRDVPCSALPSAELACDGTRCTAKAGTHASMSPSVLCVCHSCSYCSKQRVPITFMYDNCTWSVGKRAPHMGAVQTAQGSPGLCRQLSSCHSPADRGIGELNTQQDAHVQKVEDGSLHNDGNPDHDGHGLNELQAHTRATGVSAPWGQH